MRIRLALHMQIPVLTNESERSETNMVYPPYEEHFVCNTNFPTSLFLR
jgi:hypothetical protein